MSNTSTVATTILEQLGGNMFLMMIGAKNLLDLGNGLAMRVGRNAKGVNHVQVELRGDDTYTVTFSRITRRGLDVKVKHQAEGIYADQLRDLFTAQTGAAR